jgi:hypothetical protein
MRIGLCVLAQACMLHLSHYISGFESQCPHSRPGASMARAAAAAAQQQNTTIVLYLLL